MYWITEKGLGRYARLIDMWVGEDESLMEEGLARQFRLLEALEVEGKGCIFERIMEVIRGQFFIPVGTDEQYKKALDSLVRNGYVEDLS